MNDPAQSPAGGTPRWVKIFGAIAAIVIVLLVVLLLFGGGHGPGRHLADAGRDVPPSGVVSADGGA
ncbi:MAG: hypothetical protein ICV64_00840 [Thermoleophilia bacterium]|nr:hypothetical protein [Thermoleophilia bacterium]